jgi:hypothetical protein
MPIRPLPALAAGAFCWALWGGMVMAESIGFDNDAPGSPPSGWTVGVTGKGSPKWTVESDATAPGGPKVLAQSGAGTFPWAVRKDVSFANGTVEVSFKPIAGHEDAAGGIVWRWKDGDHYYVARANALENNVSLYYTVDGRRHTIRYVDAPVARNAWHTLRVDFDGTRIVVALDGKVRIEADDAHIAGAGAIGVWTKADSVTAFSGFRYAPR